MIVSIVNIMFDKYPTSDDIHKKLKTLNNYYLKHSDLEINIFSKDEKWIYKITCKQPLYKFLSTHIFLYPFMFFNMLQFNDFTTSLSYITENIKKIYQLNKKNY